MRYLLTLLILLEIQDHRELAEYAKEQASEIRLASFYHRPPQGRLLQRELVSKLLEQIRIERDRQEELAGPSPPPGGSSLFERSTLKRG